MRLRGGSSVALILRSASLFLFPGTTVLFHRVYAFEEILSNENGLESKISPTIEFGWPT